MTHGEDLERLAETHARIAIVGGPRVGKTTLAPRLANLVKGRAVVATDPYRKLPWGDVPDAIIRDALGLESYVLEGVQAARALRAGLTVDLVVFMHRAKVARTPRQLGLAKAVGKWLLGWRKDHPSVPMWVEP